MKKFVSIIILLSLAISIGYTTKPVSALSGSQFQAGRIMDDGVFFNPGSMSGVQIQQFLNSKVPQCDTNGTKPHGGTTRAAYGTSKGYPPPYTCLKSYSQNTPARAAEPGLCRAFPGGQRSSAQIIWEVGQLCNINPKVLIVLLEKEQSLVTDDWPWSVQYRSATGYGCPDTAACDSTYYGFFNQVYSAARQFNKYSRDSGNYSHIAYRDNFVRYHPNGSCGGSTVNISNQATAGLYNYTPYQPNATALSNVYGGQNDGCSSYGNRNFWRLYNDWFGSTYAPARHATYAGQSGYPRLLPGQSANAFFKFKNTGNVAWHDPFTATNGKGIINLASTNPINRASIFGSSWNSGKNRPGTKFSAVYEADGVTLASNQHIALPGQIVRYNFKFSVPSNTAPGKYREWFQPIHEGSSSWSLGAKVFLDVTVLKPYRQAAYAGQSGYPTINRGSSANSFFKFKNTGTVAWHDAHTAPNGQGRINLASTKPINRPSIFGSTWAGSKNRPSTVFDSVYESDGTTLASNQHIALPGQIVKYSFTFSVPSNAKTGKYREWFQPILEASPSWNIGGQAFLDVTVK